MARHPGRPPLSGKTGDDKAAKLIRQVQHFQVPSAKEADQGNLDTATRAQLSIVGLGAVAAARMSLLWQIGAACTPTSTLADIERSSWRQCVAEAEGLGSGVTCCGGGGQWMLGALQVHDPHYLKVSTFVDGVDPNHPVLGSSAVSDKDLVGKAKNHDNVVVCDL